jgi:tRNA(adenine34) deaminase
MDNSGWMAEALKEAIKAYEIGEIPVGAIIVKDNAIVGRGCNRRSIDMDPFCHAELAAMQEASQQMHNWRFDECTLYVTLEPCVMCAGAIVQCRVRKVVYGANDPRAGAAGSLYNILSDPRMYHQCEVISGVLKDECTKLLHNFFCNRRTQMKL